jgi:hypothetical protein
MESCSKKKTRNFGHNYTSGEKGIKILNIDRFMWTRTKRNDDKHVEWMEDWKDIAEEEDSASKARIVPLFLMDR